MQRIARALAGGGGAVEPTPEEKKIKVEAEVRYWTTRADSLKVRADLDVKREN